MVYLLRHESRDGVSGFPDLRPAENVKYFEEVWFASFTAPRHTYLLRNLIDQAHDLPNMTRLICISFFNILD